MGFITSLNIYSKNALYKDVQLWSDDDEYDQSTSHFDEKYEEVCYMNYRIVPLYLVQGKPLCTFSTNSNTQEYFERSLVRFGVNCNEVGLLMKSSMGENYLVFYVSSSESITVKCLILSFNLVEKMTSGANTLREQSAILNLSSSASDGQKSNITIFDKVLSDKKRNILINQLSINGNAKPNPSRQISLQRLSTNDQVTEATNRIILSGLRLRGFNSNKNEISSKDKIRAREIYKMTQKATMFALRKYQIHNDGKNDNIRQVTLDAIQDIVERLLSIFVDTEEGNV